MKSHERAAGSIKSIHIHQPLFPPGFSKKKGGNRIYIWGITWPHPLQSGPCFMKENIYIYILAFFFLTGVNEGK